MKSDREFVLGNPPAGVYSGDLHIGYAFYHVILDVYARHLKRKGVKVICPRYSLNVFGRRAEKVSLEKDPQLFREQMDSWAAEWPSKNRLRDRLNLSMSGTLIDNCPDSVAEAKRTFLKLDKLGYLIRSGEKFMLDTKRIADERDLINAAKDIEFYPNRTRGEFLRMLVDNTQQPVAITKSTRYSPVNPLGGENIGPLFVISTIWESKYPEGVDLLATSDKELARYTLLRYLVRMATHNDPLTRGILTFNRVSPEGGFGEWSVSDLTSDPFRTDALRYALVKAHSAHEQRTEVKKSSIVGGNRFVHLIGNLRKFFSRYGGKTLEEPLGGRGVQEYDWQMDNFRFTHVLSELETGMRRLSSKINSSRDRGTLQEDLPNLAADYRAYSSQAEPFCPAITGTAKSHKTLESIAQG